MNQCFPIPHSKNLRSPAALAASLFVGCGFAPAQSTGFHTQIVRLDGNNQVVERDVSQDGGLYRQYSEESTALGAGPDIVPYERHGISATVSIGGVFLKATAEQAGGGNEPENPNRRKITGITGATEDIVTVDAGAALAGTQGFLTVPLRIWFRAVPPAVEDGDANATGVFWTYAVNYTALTGHPDTAAVHWSVDQAHSVQSYLIFGSEILLPDGPDFNAAPVMLRVPVTFGSPELFTVTGGISAAAPLSMPRSSGNAGKVARLDVAARFLPGVPVLVETADGHEVPSGTWTVHFASRHDYSGLPVLAAPRLILPAPGQPASLEFPAAPGLDYLLESAPAVTEPWTPSGAALTGNGTTLRMEFPAVAGPSRFFRLRYTLTP